MKIHRRCKCGCGRITKPGNRYINGHHLFGNINSIGNTNAKGKRSDETIKKMSISQMGNTNAKGGKGKRKSGEHKKNISLGHIKYDPNYEYCDIWKDGEYKNDLRKDYCENIDCKNNYKRLHNHHIDLNKKNCHPKNIMTLCVSCHVSLHHKLGFNINPKDFIIINRSDYITYINKIVRNKIIIKRVNKWI